VTYLNSSLNSSFVYQNPSNSSYNLNGLQLFNSAELAINTSGHNPQKETSNYAYSLQNGWELKTFLSLSMEVIPEEGICCLGLDYWAYSAFSEVEEGVSDGPNGGLLSINFVPSFIGGINATTANTVSGETGSSADLGLMLDSGSLGLDLLSAALILAPIPVADEADLVIVPAALALDIASLYSYVGGETDASSYPSELGVMASGNQTVNLWQEVQNALPTTGSTDPTGDRLFSQYDQIDTQVFDTSSGALPVLGDGSMQIGIEGGPGLGDDEYGWGDPIDGAFAPNSYTVVPAVNIGGYVDAYPGGPAVPNAAVVLAQSCSSSSRAPSAFYDLPANNLGYWHFFGFPGCQYYVSGTGTNPDQGGTLSSGWMTVPAARTSAATVGDNETSPALNLGGAQVTFSATDLPAGASWQVDLNGSVQSSSSSTISFVEPNGTYAYTVYGPTGTIPSPASGSVTVTGVAKEISIQLLEAFTVAFEESGLYGGTDWSVTLGGATLSGTGTSISFNEANGSYSFTIGAVSGYTVSPSSGTVTVSGASVTKDISFTSTSSYSVIFKESGLPSGKTWTVVLGSNSGSAGSGSNIEFTGVTGSVSYEVDAVVISASPTEIIEYTPSPVSGTVTGATTISVTYTEKVIHISTTIGSPTLAGELAGLPFAIVSQQLATSRSADVVGAG